MRQAARRVTSLQQSYSEKNTPEMEERGRIVRNEIPDWLKSLDPALREALGIYGQDLMIEGRDGTGRKTEVPWARFCSRGYSPNARTGWYCVYLFHAKGDGFYLTLAHSSTDLRNGSFQPKPAEELHQLVEWGQMSLGTEIEGLTGAVSLGSNQKIAKAYERSIVASQWYSAGNIPPPSELAKDALTFARLLSKLYHAEDLSQSPDDPLLEAQSITNFVQNGAPRHHMGQGFGLSAPERKAVESRAMDLAAKFLRDNGYDVKDVSREKPFDFVSTRDGCDIIVEVKGSTGPCASILLTAGEVSIHTERYPRNALIVVHSIALDRGKHPVASGGKLRISLPWLIVPTGLRPLAYQYSPLDVLIPWQEDRSV